ncbi:hypothetical protein CUC53_00165 [Aeromonas cavernicola]|uniref:Uncharacterized protein n=1 Tax=Aeromonas cavernicola TaxID=1006623 RepID=A0A2H9U9U0_9GAMM|nr:hypothetical protein CUC53_00165 [Aeromonas cavernicola]
MAGRGYDTNALIEVVRAKEMKPVIPSKRHRRESREHNLEPDKAKHLVENAFLHLKQWQGIATRYAKNTSSFVAAVRIRCTCMLG